MICMIFDHAPERISLARINLMRAIRKHFSVQRETPEEEEDAEYRRRRLRILKADINDTFREKALNELEQRHKNKEAEIARRKNTQS